MGAIGLKPVELLVRDARYSLRAHVLEVNPALGDGRLCLSAGTTRQVSGPFEDAEDRRSRLIGGILPLRHGATLDFLRPAAEMGKRLGNTG